MKKSIVSLIFLIILSSAVFAASSSNYYITQEAITHGGGSSSSASYNTTGAVRHYKPEEATSAGYEIMSGFIGTVYSGISIEGAPVLISVDPSSATTGSTLSIEVIGSNISTDATYVKLSRSGESDINGSSVTVNSSTSVTCNIDLNSAAVGFWNVVVANAGPKEGTLFNAFQVLSSGPPSLVQPATNTPNPFDPKSGPTSIDFKLSQAMQITLYLFNQSGEMVWQRSLSGVQGDNSVNWFGDNIFDESVPTGVYICRIVGTVNGGSRELGRIKIAVLRR